MLREDDGKVLSWQAPPRETPRYQIAGWMADLVATGDAWVQNQPGIANLTNDIQLLMGTGQDRDMPSNLLQPDIRSFIETITDLRQIATMGSKAEQSKKTVALYNDIFKFVFWDSLYVPNTRKALQWAMLGRGYKWQKFSRPWHNGGVAKMKFEALGPREFLPDQLPHNGDLDDGYAGTIVFPMGLAEAHARFPRFQQWLTPISQYARTGVNVTPNMLRRYEFYDRWRFGGSSNSDWVEKYCVPLDSEILTKDGWKKHDELVIGQEVMGYNQTTRRCEWTKLNAINVFPEQKVYWYKSSKFSVRCTRHHRWVVRKRASLKSRKNRPEQFYRETSEFATIDDCSNASILIQSALAPSGPGLQGIDVGNYIRKGKAVEMVLQMTSGERRAFILGMLFGEGNSRTHGDGEYHYESFAQLPGPVYDAMKLACALEGISTGIGRKVGEGSETRTFSLFQNPHRRTEFKREECETQDVWCPTTGLGTWLMRQGDVITITGNCELRYHFVHDLRINDTGYMQQMGVDGTRWGYQVPSLGDLIVTVNPQNRLPQSRKAEIADCRMYPQLRLVITSPSCPVPLYDDTAFDWHGKIPVTQHDVNDWVWSPMGYSIVSGIRGLEVASRDRLSDINTVKAIEKDPPLGSDVSTGVSRTQMDKLDLLHAQGVRIGGKGDPSKWTKSLLPESLKIDETDFKTVEMLRSSIKAALGLTDIASMREVKGNMSDQAMDKIIENLGPVAKGIAVNQWIANSKDAEMLKYNIAQYFTVSMIMDMIGPEGVGVETFDNDPNSLVPSHLPGEDTGNASAHTRQERAKWYCERMRVINTPAQLLNVTHIQERMLQMYIVQQHLPVDLETTMEKIGVPDYQVRHEKWKEEQLADEIWKLEVAKAVQDKMKSLGIEPPPDQGKGQGAGGGRKPTGKTAHHPEQKGSKSGQVRVVNSSS
jgi:hypothetical protein